MLQRAWSRDAFLNNFTFGVAGTMANEAALSRVEKVPFHNQCLPIDAIYQSA
jgi:hypothetical protein